MSNFAAKGNSAENFVANHGREMGWVVGSMRHAEGAGDQLWLHPKHRPRVVEVKGCKVNDLWQNFRRADRANLIARAEYLNADPLLAHVIGSGDKRLISWFTPDQWPR